MVGSFQRQAQPLEGFIHPDRGAPAQEGSTKDFNIEVADAEGIAHLSGSTLALELAAVVIAVTRPQARSALVLAFEGTTGIFKRESAFDLSLSQGGQFRAEFPESD